MVSGILYRFKRALPSPLFLLYNKITEVYSLDSSYKRNNSDGKESVKRQRTPETTTDTKDVSKLYRFYVLNIHISKYLLK